ncbi:MAG: hypothetical protein QNJ00_18560 [Woeseiaceae bacterium]|nr:hypothetical protein [Woeseiaceae bacterium]
MPHQDLISSTDMDALLEPRDGPCISIYLPTSRVSQDTDEDRILLKNLRTEAFEALTGAEGLRRPDAEAMLAPVDELLEDDSFWPYLSDGLAVFLAPGVNLAYRVPESFAPRAVVGFRFVVKPLLPLLTGNGVYYVIAVSRNEVRLFEGTRSGATEVDVERMPANMLRAMSMRGREGDRAPHKQWQGDEGQKTLYLKFFRQIDRALRPYFGGRTDPLVVAGVSYLQPIFREATSYRQLVDEGIDGNPDEFSAAEIHSKAWPLVEPLLDAPRRDVLRRLGAAWGSGQVADDIATILGAAYDGRVEALLVDLESDILGTFDTKTRETVTGSDAPESGSNDLTGLAASFTYARGGEIYAASKEEIPDGRPIAALLRY